MFLNGIFLSSEYQSNFNFCHIIMSKSVADIIVFIVKLIIDFVLTVIVALPLLIVELIYVILPRRKKKIAGQLVVVSLLDKIY